MRNRTLYAQPHLNDYSDSTDDQHIQSDYISTYQNGTLNNDERTELLSIMNEKTKKQLHDNYLEELEKRLDEMDKYHHPAVISGRRIVTDIKQGLLNKNHAIALLHHTVNLAKTSADDANFQKKADNFLRATGKINSEANGFIATGVVFAFVSACALACAITAVVMIGMVAYLPLVLYVGFCSGTGILSGLGAVGMFGCANHYKSTVKDLGAFGSAMQGNNPQENKHQENREQEDRQEHIPLLQMK